MLSQSIVEKCVAIMQPTAPLALRLSSILQLGVVKLYRKQVDYLLDDCAAFLAKLRLVAYHHANVLTKKGGGKKSLLLPSQRSLFGGAGGDILDVGDPFADGEPMLLLLNDPLLGQAATSASLSSKKKRKRDNSNGGSRSTSGLTLGDVRADDLAADNDFLILNPGDAMLDVSEGGDFFVPNSLAAQLQHNHQLLGGGGPPPPPPPSSEARGNDDADLLPVDHNNNGDDDMDFLPVGGGYDDEDMLPPPPPGGDDEYDATTPPPGAAAAGASAMAGDTPPPLRSALKPRGRGRRVALLVDDQTTIPSAVYREWTKNPDRLVGIPMSAKRRPSAVLQALLVAPAVCLASAPPSLAIRALHAAAASTLAGQAADGDRRAKKKRRKVQHGDDDADSPPLPVAFEDDDDGAPPPPLPDGEDDGIYGQTTLLDDDKDPAANLLGRFSTAEEVEVERLRAAVLSATPASRSGASPLGGGGGGSMRFGLTTPGTSGGGGADARTSRRTSRLESVPDEDVADINNDDFAALPTTPDVLPDVPVTLTATGDVALLEETQTQTQHPSLAPPPPSSATVNASLLQVLREAFARGGDAPQVSFLRAAGGMRSRRKAARLFVNVLELAAANLLKLDQHAPYDDIVLKPGVAM